MFEGHARTPKLRSTEPSAKAFVINIRGQDPIEQATAKILRLSTGAESTLQEVSIIIPLRIELCRLNSQPSHVSTVAQPVLQFLAQTTGYRGGIGRRLQADSIFAGAAGFQCTAIAATACAYSLVKDLHHWNIDDMDTVLEVGTKFYEYCSRVRRIPNRFLASSEVQGVETFPSSKSFEITPTTGQRVKSAFITCTQNLSTSFPIIENDINELQRDTFLTLIARGNSTPIINMGNKIYIFRFQFAYLLPVYGFKWSMVVVGVFPAFKSGNTS